MTRKMGPPPSCLSSRTTKPRNKSKKRDGRQVHTNLPSSTVEVPDVTSLKLENIRKTYSLGKVSVPVLKGLSLTIERGDMVALMGSSGSGKTTLVNLLGSL